MIAVFRTSHAFRFLAVAFATVSSVAVYGQADAVSHTDAAVAELRIDIRTQLNFSRATVSKQGGKISVNPETGTRDVNGGVIDLGGMALAGTAVVTGQAGRSVRIDMPQTVRMSNTRGGALIIRNLRTNLSPAPKLDNFGRLEFAFGGDLEIDGKAYGDYRGRIPITVEYE
jgi:Domain of unknown function (DUF4402)